MARGTFTITGLDKLAKDIQERAKMELVKEIVKTNGAEMQKLMINNAVFVKGYSTGATRQSISGFISDGGFTYTAGAKTEYAPFLEYGTRFMASQSFVKPSFDAQKQQFLNDIEKMNG